MPSASIRTLDKRLLVSGNTKLEKCDAFGVKKLGVLIWILFQDEGASERAVGQFSFS